MALQAGLRWTFSAALLIGTAGAAYPWPSWVKQSIYTEGYHGYGNAKLTTLFSFGCRHDGDDHGWGGGCHRQDIGALPLAGLAFAGQALIGTTSLRGSAYKLLPPGQAGHGWTAHGIGSLANGTNTPLTQIGEDVYAGTEPGDVFLLTNTDGNARKFIIYQFTGGAGGYAPLSGLTVSPSGVLYGTAAGGPVWARAGVCADAVVRRQLQGKRCLCLRRRLGGQHPGGGVALGADGRLYGTTISGGKLSCTYAQGGWAQGCGVLYRLTPPSGGNGPWTQTVLHAFAGGADGAGPGDVTLDSHGDIFGATIAGGVKNLGTIYEAQPAAVASYSWSVLWSFDGGKDGHTPNTKLALDAGGALYGTAQGGDHWDGNLFILVPPYLGYAWQFSVIHSFDGNDGATPVGGLILDTAGSIFGVTLFGGAYDGGTAYEVVP